MLKYDEAQLIRDLKYLVHNHSEGISRGFFTIWRYEGEEIIVDSTLSGVYVRWKDDPEGLDRTQDPDIHPKVLEEVVKMENHHGK